MTQRGCTRSSRERDVISRSTKWLSEITLGGKMMKNFHLRRLQIQCEMMCASTIQNRKTRSSMRSSESRDIQSVSTVIIDIDSQNWQKPEAAPTWPLSVKLIKRNNPRPRKECVVFELHDSHRCWRGWSPPNPQNLRIQTHQQVK